MKLIILRGGKSSGKTQTLRLVYNRLVDKHQFGVIEKELIGRNKEDFTVILGTSTLKVGLVSSTSTTEEIRDYIAFFERNFCDLGILAYWSFWNKYSLYDGYDSEILNKHIQWGVPFDSANEFDASIIISKVIGYKG